MDKPIQGQEPEAFPTIEEHAMESNQNDPWASQVDSPCEVRNGTKRPDKQPALTAVQPSSPPFTPRIEVDFKYLDDGRIVELVEDPADDDGARLEADSVAD